MPTNDKAQPAYAVDTSVAIPFLDATHSAHSVCVAELASKRLALAGHAAFESLAVLTRLSGALRVDMVDALAAIRLAFPESCWLAAEHQAELLDRLGSSGLRGGMIYDALVGEAARVNGRVLLSRDRRAIATYEFLGINYQLIG